jgi:hypothetical protein
MLHITHRQTTAFCPESNGAVKILHRRLKDALHDGIAEATWAEEIPWVLLGLRAQPREDSGLSPAQAVFGPPVVLPNEFLQGDEMKNFTNLWMLLLYLCPGTIQVVSCLASSWLISSAPASSGSGVAAWSPLFTLSMTAPTLSSTG